MPTTLDNIDIERRVEAAALELLKAFTPLVSSVGATARIHVRRDAASGADYPCATVQAIGFAEFVDVQTGWYRGGLQVAAMTYRADDKDQKVAKGILGVLRAWAQRTDLVSQLNATTSAQAAGCELDVRDIRLDDRAFDASDERTLEWVLPLAVLCRPSRA